MSVDGGRSEPFQSLGEILRNAFSQQIQTTEIRLSISIALFCGFPEPADGLFVILRNPSTDDVQPSEMMLSRGIPPLRQHRPLAQRGRIVASIIRRHPVREAWFPGRCAAGVQQRDGEEKTRGDEPPVHYQ